jgi:hypothetical protein
LETYSVTIRHADLRKATTAASNSSKPGYTLCYHLLPCCFSTEELAHSRGQGLVDAAKGDIRPALDRERLDAIKGKYDHGQYSKYLGPIQARPDDSDFKINCIQAPNVEHEIIINSEPIKMHM